MPDTIERLEEGVRAQLAGHPRSPPASPHRVSVVFLDRGEPRTELSTSLEVNWISDLPLRCSSTGIRAALGGGGHREQLAALPFSVYRCIHAMGLYGGSADGACALPRGIVIPRPLCASGAPCLRWAGESI